MDTRDHPGRLLRLAGLLRDVIVGTLLCLHPITSILALGWMTRRMAATVAERLNGTSVRPGWILGGRDAGRVHRALGGLAANIQTGLRAAAGLFLLTLPFTLAWLGAWWAGWENSFNKGYEQSSIGPLIWGAATVFALPILAHLPIALAHAAHERRLGAFWELSQIRRIANATGWRLLALAILSVAASGAFFALRTVPVFIEGWVPGFAGLGPDQQAAIAGQIDLLGAALAFILMAFLRHQAAVAYAVAINRTAQNERPPRFTSAVWLTLTCAVWLALPLLIVAGQFLNYAPELWLLHPVLTLPWAG